MNTADGRFANASATLGLDLNDDGRTVALTDWDRDGDVDIWLGNRTAPTIRYMQNDGPKNNHSVAIKLRGQQCNRDAIGARVTVTTGDGQTLIRTLRAGEGFLSQSSKWLHFGLGTAATLKNVTVRWPGGSSESFADVAINGRYMLEQGKGRAASVRAQSPRKKLSNPPLDVPKESAKGRLFLTLPVPLPVLTYSDLDGKHHTLKAPGRRMLVSLWASWCKPCIAELAALSREHQRLAKAGIDVLALNTDKLTDPDSGSPGDLKRTLADLAYPFQAGVAHVPTLDQLENLHMALANTKLPLPLPTSFLIDEKGYVGAIYRGAVSVETLISDAAHFDLSPAARKHIAGHFPGKWYSPSAHRDFGVLAKLFLLLGYPQTAVRMSKAAVQTAPNDANARRQHGSLLAQLSRQADAEAHLLEALRLDPKNVDGYRLAALCEADLDKNAEAVRHLRTAIELAPNNAGLRMFLAEQLLKTDDLQAAQKHLEEVLRLDPKSESAKNRLKMLNRRKNN